jgi:hypothetical protein
MSEPTNDRRDDHPQDSPPEPRPPRKNTGAIVCFVLAAAYALFALPGLPASLRHQAEQGKDTGSLVAFTAGYFTPPVILAVIGFVLYKRPRRE